VGGARVAGWRVVFEPEHGRAIERVPSSGGSFALELDPGVYRVGASQHAGRRARRLCGERSLRVPRQSHPPFVRIVCRVER
jgi:hypothetical protein